MTLETPRAPRARGAVPARPRPGSARRTVRSFAGSAATHALVLVVALLVPSVALDEGLPGPKPTLRVAHEQPPLEWRVEPEPLPELEPAELHERPELVERELPPEEPPPEEPPPPPPDVRPELVDPLRGRTFAAFHVTSEPEPVEDPPPDPPPDPPRTAPPPAPPPASAPPPDPGLEPEVVDGPTPRYPRASRRLGETGSVTLRAVVGLDGAVREIQVLSSSGFSRLDQAARQAFSEWTFRAWREGEPVERTYTKTFTFRIE